MLVVRTHVLCGICVCVEGLVHSTSQLLHGVQSLKSYLGPPGGISMLQTNRLTVQQE